MSRRRALLIATGRYEDPRWNPLEAPLRDAGALAGVLRDPVIGGYEVTQVLDQPAYSIQRALQRFFTEAQRDDELLVYFSCHGIKDYDESLYFAGTDTLKEPDLLESYAVPADFVSRQLQRCRAERKVLLLDCCFSGAFRLGAKGDSTSIDLGGPFDGSGTVVISATDETQLAFELVPEGTGGGPLSVFTSALVEGLRKGVADADGDGRVSVLDLFRYVSQEMRRAHARQTPKLWILDGVGSLVVARRGQGGAWPSAPSPAGPDGRSQGQVAPAVPASLAVPAGGPAAEVLAGLAPVAHLLERTVGPRPRPAMISREDGSVQAYTDTVVIAREVVTPPGRAAVGTGLVRDLVHRMRRQAGDGAATAAVVLHASLRHLQRVVDAGTSPILLARALPGTLRRAETLLGEGRRVETKEEITQIVVTTLRAARMGRAIAEALDKVGRDGVLVAEESQSFGLEVELVEGMAFKGDCLSPYFITDEEAGTAVLEKPYVLLHEQAVSSVGSLLPLMQKVKATGAPLLVVAGDVEAEVLSMLVVNNTKGAFTSVAVRGPHRGPRGSLALLGDLAVVTGGEVITEKVGLRLESAGLDLLGRARRVVVTKEETTVIDGAGASQHMSGRVDQIRAEIENSPSEDARDRLRDRLARLAGGVAIVRVGAPTRAEREQQADTLRLAIRLAKAAVAEGVVPGAAAALAAVGGRLATQAGSGPGTGAAGAAADALDRALAHGLVQPLRVLADNSGDPDTAAVVATVQAAWPERTYDAVSGTCAEASTAGIWDPVTVPRTVLREVARSIDEYLSVI
ncbi:chaperonin GroEL [Streptomyces sp. NPDC003781]|uniref:chaperonin GroEL n=1 Tax=Streptomyces sp. NPDC003781 TaxID=3364686 RepID=UPI0036CCAD54